MDTATKPNKYTLSRQAWPQSDNLIYCTINDIDMVSLGGYHASTLTPQYAYLGKMDKRNSRSTPAKMDFEVSSQPVKVVATDDDWSTLSNGVRLNKHYAEYYLDAYPGAQWYNDDSKLQPIAIVQGSLVAVIMPIRD